MASLNQKITFKSRSITGVIQVVAMLLLLCSELFYVLTSYGPVSVFWLSAVPLAVAWAFLSDRLPMTPPMVASYVFYLTLALYTLIGMVAYYRVSLGIQFISSLLSAYLFLNIGYYGNKKLIVRSLILVLCGVIIFALSQFIYFNFGTAGPYSIFKSIANFMVNTQNDFLVENIYGRSSGIFTSPNALGFFGGISFWIFCILSSQVSRFTFFSALGLSIFCVVLSISRGSIFGLVASIIYFFCFSGWWRRVNASSMVLSLVAFFVISFLFVYYSYSLNDVQTLRYSEIFSVVSGDYSESVNLSARFQAWSSIFVYISNSPFGTILPPQLLIDESPDNQFFYYFAQGGLILLIVSIAFYTVLFYSAFYSSNKNRFVFASAAIFVVVNCFSITLMNSYIYMLFCMMIGLFSRDRLRV